LTYAQIVELTEAERPLTIDGREMVRGRSLASLIHELGGYEGEVKEALTGRTHRISLLPWRDRDPHSTWLEVSFITEMKAPG
jgi:hypothetical protein